MESQPTEAQVKAWNEATGGGLVSFNSLCNESEAMQVLDLVEEILFATKNNQLPVNISIIAFYKAQVVLLGQLMAKRAALAAFAPLSQMDRLKSKPKSELSDQELERPRVLLQTVDSAQGSESDVVILSPVRCNASCEVGFLCSPNRLNVACSRARYSLIVAGCYHTLQNEEIFRRIFLADGRPTGVRVSWAAATAAAASKTAPSAKKNLEDDFM
jgi:superfamily I DNA and/or RNA helicase